MSELLPCPFCGGQPEMRESSTHDFYIKCKGCGVATRKNHENRVGAVMDWNARVDTEYGAIPATDENMAKHGWVRERTCHDTGENEWHFICSTCGYEQNGYEQWNYCPNCGAKVVSE